MNAEWSVSTPLAYAILDGQLPAVRFLVKEGANVNVHFGLPQRTALMQATEGGVLEIVTYLVDADDDINARNRFGRTALYHARHSLFRDQAVAAEIAGYLESKGAVE